MGRRKGSKNKPKPPVDPQKKSRREQLRKLFRESPETALKLFEQFLNIARGKVDIKYRLRLLLEPDNIKTTTRLTGGQVDFVSLSFFMSSKFEEEGFKPLEDYATEFCLANISLRGLGREEAIQYESAIGESRLLSKLNIFKTQESGGKAGGKT